MYKGFKNIVIVGGGSAGWLMARALSEPKDRNITLIESDEIKPIGVGEGSWPLLMPPLKRWKINLNKINSTHKLGINYLNWYSNDDSKYNDWYHPFKSIPSDFMFNFFK